MYEDLSCIITELFNNYLTVEDPKLKQVLKEQIVEKIRELTYFWPQLYFKLNEEDCAELLLKFDGRIDGIIESYDTSYNDFGAYIFPIIKKFVQGFCREKIRKRNREESVLVGYTAYEFLLSENENSTENRVVSEAMNGINDDDHIFIQRMYAVFVKSPLARERFYVFLIARSNEIPASTIYELCKTYRFNYEETRQIIEYIDRHRQRGREDVGHAIEKKNEYFGKRLYLENELARRNYLADHSMDQRIIEKLERITFYYDSKTKYINSQSRASARKLVSSLIHKNYGTIGTYLMYSGRLVCWCMDPERPMNFGVTTKILEDIANTTDFSSYEACELEMLNPISAFRINIPLNS